MTDAANGYELSVTRYIWPSKEAREAGNKAAMADPRLANMGPDSMPFDGKRMFYGGFAPIVDRSKEG